MNSELARIHARICGDGNISKYKSSESDRDRRAEVVYTNKSKRNIKEFREDLKSCFDVKGTVYEDRLRLKSIRVVEELESKFGKFGSKEFEIPSEIKKSEEEISMSG